MRSFGGFLAEPLMALIKLSSFLGSKNGSLWSLQQSVKPAAGSSGRRFLDERLS